MSRILTLLVALTVLYVTPQVVQAGSGDNHGGGHEEEHEPEKGPYGGRLLKGGDFKIEVTIFEKGVPPQYRVYGYNDKRAINPKDFSVKISLNRFGNKKDDFIFSPQGAFLTSDKVVEEPHSFDVLVEATYKGESYKWQYDSYEGRTELSDEAQKAAKIKLSQVSPQRIEKWVEVYGKLVPQENRVAHITPRFAGIVREMRKNLGDMVSKNEVLAVVESNQGLQPYEVRSQIAGLIVEQHVTLGEYVSDGSSIFVVADLTQLVAEFQVYRDDFDQISNGQKVKVLLEKEAPPIETSVSYISPITDNATQSKMIRAQVMNENLTLRPGLFVTGEISVLSKEVQRAVKRSAIQSFRDWDVVFLNEGHVFQAIPVELGAADSDFVEIISGLLGGEKYVSENSYIIKADIEKSGASHDH